MLPKDLRVTTEVFKKVLKEGVSLHTPALSFRYYKETTHRPSRFSVFVPKKVLKKAVDRNRLKRRINACLVEMYPVLNQSFTGVFFAKQNTCTLPAETLKKEIVEILTRAKVLN